MSRTDPSEWAKTTPEAKAPAEAPYRSDGGRQPIMDVTLIVNFPWAESGTDGARLQVRDLRRVLDTIEEYGIGDDTLIEPYVNDADGFGIRIGSR